MSEQTKMEKVHHVFEKISNQYDSMNSIITFKRHTAWRQDVMKRMNVKEGSKALDVYTGTGEWAIALVNYFVFLAGSRGCVLIFSNNPR